MTGTDEIRIGLRAEATTGAEKCNGSDKGEAEADGDAVRKGTITKVIHQAEQFGLISLLACCIGEWVWGVVGRHT